MWKRYENQNRRGRSETTGGKRRTRENETKKTLTYIASVALQIRKCELQTAERSQCQNTWKEMSLNGFKYALDRK